MFWLAYRCENDPCVIVIDAKSIVLARLLAAMVVDGIDTHFIEGGETRICRRMTPASTLERLAFS